MSATKVVQIRVNPAALMQVMQASSCPQAAGVTGSGPSRRRSEGGLRHSCALKHGRRRRTRQSPSQRDEACPTSCSRGSAANPQPSYAAALAEVGDVTLRGLCFRAAVGWGASACIVLSAELPAGLLAEDLHSLPQAVDLGTFCS